MAQGLMVFSSVADAVRAGYRVYDRTRDGYIVRTNINGRWALAVVRAQYDG
jgi:hypothetical protein